MSLLDSLIEADLVLPPLLVQGAFAREIWICRRSDGGSQLVFGSGSQDDPYDGSTADKLDFILFNIVFGLIPNPVVRFGPGSFETRGNAAWAAINGRILGSGMFVTTLKLIDVTSIQLHRWIVVSSGSLTSFEISDLTLDANIMGQPNSPNPGGGTFDYARVCVGGLNVTGSNIAVRRVRVIGCGTHQPTNEYLPITPTPGTNECFALWVKSTGPGNVIEDCIVEKFSKNNGKEVTCLDVGNTEDGYGQPIFYPTTVRNCLVDGQMNGVTIRENIMKGVAPVSGTTTTFDFEFWEEHHRLDGDFIAISDMELSDDSPPKHNPYNGYFKVTFVTSTKLRVTLQAAPSAGSITRWGRMIWTFQGMAGTGALDTVFEGNRVIGTTRGYYQDTWSSRGYILRNNYFRDVYNGINMLMGGNDEPYMAGPLGRPGSISKTAGANSNVRFTMQTGNHGHAQGDIVQIGNYSGGTPEYFGTFTVTEIISPTTFGWTMSPLPSPPPGSGVLYQCLLDGRAGSIAKTGTSLSNVRFTLPDISRNAFARKSTNALAVAVSPQRRNSACQ
jgi:hypothetical protein